MRPVIHGGGHIRATDLVHDSIDAIHLAPGNKTSILSAIPFVIFAELDATTTSVTYTLPKGVKIRVIDAWGIMTGAAGAGDTYNITDGTTSITGGAIDLSLAGDTDIVRTGEIDDAAHEISGGGTIVFSNASDALVDVYALCIRMN